MRRSNSKKNEYEFEVAENKKIKISSKFESGNIRLIRQVNSQSVS